MAVAQDGSQRGNILDKVPGGQICLDDALKGYQRKMRRWPTRSEKRFKNVLDQFCEAFRQQYVFQAYFFNKKVDRHYFVDFCVPFYRAVFEVDGLAHDNPAQKEDDRIRDDYLNKVGYHVYRITNLDTKRTDRCQLVIWQAFTNRTAPSEARPNLKPDEKQDKKLVYEWLKKHKKKQRGIWCKNRFKDRSNKIEGVEPQDDPQKAYEQCLNYLKRLPSKPIKKVESLIVSRKLREKQKREVQCPTCKRLVDIKQAQCSYCGTIREVARKYLNEQLPTKVAINVNPNTPKVILRKQAQSGTARGLSE